MTTRSESGASCCRREKTNCPFTACCGGPCFVGSSTSSGGSRAGDGGGGMVQHSVFEASSIPAVNSVYHPRDCDPKQPGIHQIRIPKGMTQPRMHPPPVLTESCWRWGVLCPRRIPLFTAPFTAGPPFSSFSAPQPSGAPALLPPCSARTPSGG